MKKKILIGSLLVLTLLLLMPSIPAIQQTTFEDKAYSDFVEKFGDIDLENIELKLPEIYGYEGFWEDIWNSILFLILWYLLCLGEIINFILRWWMPPPIISNPVDIEV